MYADDPMLPEGASGNPSAPYNQGDEPEVMEYEVQAECGKYATVKSYSAAKKRAEGWARQFNCAVHITALFDTGETFTVAELSGDEGEVVWEYGQDYDGSYGEAAHG